MVDFLKNNPYVTREEYLWEWTIPQVKLATYDNTHVVYLSEKEAKKRARKEIKFDNPMDFVNSFNIPKLKHN